MLFKISLPAVPIWLTVRVKLCIGLGKVYDYFRGGYPIETAPGKNTLSKNKFFIYFLTATKSRESTYLIF